MPENTPNLLEIAPDVAGFALPIVNLYFVGMPHHGDRSWVLVDAGLPGFAGQIIRAAEDRFGPDARPAAILLTHGHFDHIGVLGKLAEHWDVPIYVHPLELPYLTGHSAYPPADPTVGGGLMSLTGPLFPAGPFDFGDRMHALPDDGSVPHLPGWRAIHTPGHSPGHVSFWRDEDGVLIAGDAFVTTKQESAIAALTKPKVVHGPPMYFTPDWESSRQSVRELSTLAIAVAATGHGLPMRGAELAEGLETLSREFDDRAIPKHGRYVRQPAVTDETGVVSVPPAPLASFPLLLAAGAVIAGVVVSLLRRGRTGRVALPT